MVYIFAMHRCLSSVQWNIHIAGRKGTMQHVRNVNINNALRIMASFLKDGLHNKNKQPKTESLRVSSRRIYTTYMGGQISVNTVHTSEPMQHLTVVRRCGYSVT